MGLARIAGQTYFVRTNEFAPANQLSYAFVNVDDNSKMLVANLATNRSSGKPSERLNLSGISLHNGKPYLGPNINLGSNNFVAITQSPARTDGLVAYLAPADAEVEYNLTALKAPGKIYTLQATKTEDFLRGQRERELARDR